jgi:hypothetical protein
MVFGDVPGDEPAPSPIARLPWCGPKALGALYHTEAQLHEMEDDWHEKVSRG